MCFSSCLLVTECGGGSSWSTCPHWQRLPLSGCSWVAPAFLSMVGGSMCLPKVASDKVCIWVRPVAVALAPLRPGQAVLLQETPYPGRAEELFASDDVEDRVVLAAVLRKCCVTTVADKLQLQKQCQEASQRSAAGNLQHFVVLYKYSYESKCLSCT